MWQITAIYFWCRSKDLTNRILSILYLYKIIYVIYFNNRRIASDSIRTNFFIRCFFNYKIYINLFFYVLFSKFILCTVWQHCVNTASSHISVGEVCGLCNNFTALLKRSVASYHAQQRLLCFIFNFNFVIRIRICSNICINGNFVRKTKLFIQLLCECACV